MVDLSGIPIISMWRPWADFVALGWKTIETRTHKRFAGLVGKRIAIHAAQRLCIFYKHADRWIGKPVEWIVCKACQKKLVAGQVLELTNPLLGFAKLDKLFVPVAKAKIQARPVWKPSKRYRAGDKVVGLSGNVEAVVGQHGENVQIVGARRQVGGAQEKPGQPLDAVGPEVGNTGRGKLTFR